MFTKKISSSLIKIFCIAISTTAFAEDNLGVIANKEFSIGFYSSFQNSDFSFDTPAAHSILKWREMKGYNIGTELKYQIFNSQEEYLINKSNIFLNYSYSELKGEGTDDDISNYGGGYSISKAEGNINDVRLIADIESIDFSGFAPAIRLGGFYKRVNFDMRGGYFLYANDKGALIGEFLDDLTARTSSEFSGATVGGKITHKTDSSENILLFDFYPSVKYHGNQNWPLRELRWKLSSASPGIGFKIGLEHYFKVSNQAFKLFSSFESIKIKKLKEFEPGYSVIGGSKNSAVNGNASFNAFNIGAGIYF